MRAITSQLEADSSGMRDVLGTIGTSVSGVFLWLIGILNLVILIGIVRIFRRMRHGELDEAALEEPLHQRGLAGPVMRRLGIVMCFAYGWAFTKPLRRVYYNLVITALSVAVALVIGTIELASVLADRVGITSGPIAAIGSIDLDGVGFVVVALIIAAWIIAVLAWRWGDVERRWTSRISQRPTPPH